MAKEDSSSEVRVGHPLAACSSTYPSPGRTHHMDSDPSPSLEPTQHRDSGRTEVE